VDFARSNDRSLLSVCDSVRRQVEADKSLTGRHRFIGNTAKHYAGRPRQQME
jgi:hypothetical protein